MIQNLYDMPVSSYEDIMDICRAETRERISETLRLCMPFADTPEGKILMEEQLYGILIQMLTYVQVSSKKLRKDKQREGIDAAMANGVQFGRRQKFSADDYIDVYKRLENKEITKPEARAEIGASYNTFVRMYRELKQDGKI
ncbi:MAG: hypothetical protein IJR59_05350 [Firmicutes bacterium]|nr:hypothetical protein [Bacillota bacterium]